MNHIWSPWLLSTESFSYPANDFLGIIVCIYICAGIYSLPVHSSDAEVAHVHTPLE